MKRLSFFLIVISLILYLLCFPSRALAASANGINLWFHSVLPTLLPFMILSGLLVRSGAIGALTRWIPSFLCGLFGLSPQGIYVLFLGLFCGYPMGAKLTADLYLEGQISQNEAAYLLTFSNNPGPMFISGYLMHQTLGLHHRCALAFFCMYLSTLLCSLVFRTVYHRWHTAGMTVTSRCKASAKNIRWTSHGNKKEVSSIPLPELVDTSIMNGFESVTKLGGYILLFSLISAMLEIVIPDGAFGYLLRSITEITTGSAVIAKLSWPLPLKSTMILGAASFGGVSCIFQTSSMIQDTNLSLSMYCAAKILNGFLTFLLAGLFFFIL